MTVQRVKFCAMRVHNLVRQGSANIHALHEIEDAVSQHVAKHIAAFGLWFCSYAVVCCAVMCYAAQCCLTVQCSAVLHSAMLH